MEPRILLIMRIKNFGLRVSLIMNFANPKLKYEKLIV